MATICAIGTNHFLPIRTERWQVFQAGLEVTDGGVFRWCIKRPFLFESASYRLAKNYIASKYPTLYIIDDYHYHDGLSNYILANSGALRHLSGLTDDAPDGVVQDKIRDMLYE